MFVTVDSSKRSTMALLRGFSVLCALVLLAGCGPAAAALSPTATIPPPTATSIPPTATPVPPTATPLPTPTVELAPLPSDGGVVYNEPDGGSSQRITIRRPDVGGPPYPWVFVTTCSDSPCTWGGCQTCASYVYADFGEELLARGYATVMLTTYGLKGNEFCAWAWLEENAAAYGLDMERAIVFSHSFGPTGPVLGVADDALWTELLAGCSSPPPSQVHIRGVATYSGWFVAPGGSVVGDDRWPGKITSLLNESQDAIEVSVEAVEQLFSVVEELPPSEWQTSDRLDEEMRFVAHRLPLYYVYGPKPADQMPAFLLTHGGQMNADYMLEQPLEESEMMAQALDEAGLSVETLWLPDAGFYDVMYADTGVPEQLAEAIDTWAQGLFAEP